MNNDSHPWVIPSRTRGNRQEDHTYKWVVEYHQAVKEIAAELSEECGRKIGFATLNMNLATQRSAYFTEVRRRLNKRVKQITKENKRHAHQDRQIRKESELRL